MPSSRTLAFRLARLTELPRARSGCTTKPDMVEREAQPALTSSTDMLKFMEEALYELEEAQGGQDPQARAQLDKLRQQTAALSRLEGQAQQLNRSSTQAVDELAIAGQIDNLDGQLRSLEASIAKADPATQQLFSQSTALWLQQQQEQKQQDEQRS